MDTSGRAVLLAGATVVIALLGMFATGVAFMYGLAIAAVMAVLLVLRPRSRCCRRCWRAGSVRGSSVLAVPGASRAPPRAPSAAGDDLPKRSAWRRWSETVQARPWPLVLGALALMIVLVLPVLSMRLDSSDAGNDPANTSSRHAFDLLGQGFEKGFNGPLLLVAELPGGKARPHWLRSAHSPAPPQGSSRLRCRGSRPPGNSPSSTPTRVRHPGRRDDEPRHPPPR